jgi:hypothetical protein
MTNVVRLELSDFISRAQWRWTLSDPTGILAVHNVDLDIRCPEFEAMGDLHRFLSLNAAPDRRRENEAELIADTYRWIGERVFGDIGLELARRAPVIVHVVIPQAAEIVASYPLESAIVDGEMLAVRQVSLFFDVEVGRPARGGVKRPVGSRLRMLGLFTLPSGEAALNLRKERYQLARTVSQIAGERHLAVELKVLQYGVTREVIRQVGRDGESWDVLHLSGHGVAGHLLLETADGSTDLITAAELADLLEPLADQVKLITVSSCSSAALRTGGHFALPGAVPTTSGKPPQPGSSGAGDDEHVPALAVELASRLDVPVLAMRFPVADDLAIELTDRIYRAILGRVTTLPDAVGAVLPDLVAYASDHGYPPWSVGAPAMFGAKAADTRLQAPTGDFVTAPTPTGHPPPADLFVGRGDIMTRASAVLAHGSGMSGLVLQGMPGVGKTACARELLHCHVDSFEQVVWFGVPGEDTDAVGAFSLFALALLKLLSADTELSEAEFGSLIDDRDKFGRLMPLLKVYAARHRWLVIIDNAESLLTDTGNWRDDRWGLVLDALTLPESSSRIIITSRAPLSWPSARWESQPLHALSRDEAQLLARELPGFRKLLNGNAPGWEPGPARQAASRLLGAARGHPELLMLASGQAEDPSRLNLLVERATRIWDGPAEGDYADVVTAWTELAVDDLSSEERLFLWFVCALEETDRSGPHAGAVIETTWPDVWCLTGAAADPPVPGELMRTLSVRALAETGQEPERWRAGGCRIHPLITATVRQQAGAEFQTIVDAALVSYWMSALRGARPGTDTEATSLIVTAGKSALPYLQRAKAWKEAREAFDQAMIRDYSRAAVESALPVAYLLVKSSAGTDEQLWLQRSLARLWSWFDVDKGLPKLRRVVAEAVSAERYDLASVATADLINGYRMAGSLDEALAAARSKHDYSRRAGFGPWTLLADETMELQIHALKGHSERVLAEIDRLLHHARSLPEVQGPDERQPPWNVRETLLYIGDYVTSDLGLWERSLHFLQMIATSQEVRGASPHDVIRTKFDMHGSLVNLGRFREAIALLTECRKHYDDNRDQRMQGQVLSALADTWDKRGNGSRAIALEQEALRLRYKANDRQGIAISHRNIGDYMAHHCDDAPTAAAHHLAAALLFALMGDGYLHRTVQCLRRDLAALPKQAVIPTTVTALAQAVGVINGTESAPLLGAAQTGEEAAQRALDSILSQVRSPLDSAPGQPGA